MDVVKTGLNRQKKKILNSLLGIAGLWGLANASSALNHSQIEVADVTAKSFTVVWQVDEAATPNIEIFTDVQGLEPANNAAITTSYTSSGDTALAQLAEDQGIMRVKISGLKPDTPYFYRLTTTPKSANPATTFPVSGALPSVQTKAYSLPVVNDSFATNIFQSDTTTAATGSVLFLNTPDSEYPISYMVGDGYQSELATLNLSNLYDDLNQTRLQLTNGEQVSLQVMGGLQGQAYFEETLATNSGQADLQFFTASPINLIATQDSDGDGIDDVFEQQNGLDPNNAGDAALDNDGDGLTNQQEFEHGANPNSNDTDGDGLLDADEIAQGTLINQADSDRDGRSDNEELTGGILTNPLNADSDGDGVNDSAEITAGTDPNDAADLPLIDSDGDSIADGIDNCIDLPNPDQLDADLDGFGDICDLDDDNDGVLDVDDNAPFDANADQADVDNDGVGDVADNCLGLANTDQLDTDDDGEGNACDVDDDNDGVNDYGPEQLKTDFALMLSNITSLVGSTIAVNSNNQAVIGIYKTVTSTGDTILLGVFNLATRVYSPEILSPEDENAVGILSVKLDLMNCGCFNNFITRDGDIIFIETTENIIPVTLPELTVDNPSFNGFAFVATDGTTYSHRIIAPGIVRLVNLLKTAHTAQPLDNCRLIPNPDQSDIDGDGIGDACDFTPDDLDGDGIFNELDNCPDTHNNDQNDLDGDSIGDVCDPDVDNDGLSNDEERNITYSNIYDADTDNDGISDADEDLDFDGVSNIDEIRSLQNPVAPTINLVAGTNLFNYPVEVSVGLNAFTLLEQLGGLGSAQSIERFNKQTQAFEIAEYVNGVAEGINFPILDTEGYRIEMANSFTLELDTEQACSALSLNAGLNIVGINCIPVGTSAFDLLEILGGEQSVVDVQRLNTMTGLFETASYVNGEPSGDDFIIISTEAYFVNMLEAQAISDFALEPAQIVVSSHQTGGVHFGLTQSISGNLNSPNTYVLVNGVQAQISEANGNITFVADVELPQGHQTIEIVSRTADNILSTETFDIMIGILGTIGTNGDDVLGGDAENNNIDGRGGNDIIYGFDGNDLLDGGSDDGSDIDRLIGGLGDDRLWHGNEFYYDLGDGSDIISNIDGQGRIIFGPNIIAEDFSMFLSSANNLRMFFGDTGFWAEFLTVEDFFVDGVQKIISLEFEREGLVLDAAQIMDMLYQGDEGQNGFVTSPHVGVLNGFGGDDTFGIYHEDGVYTIIGGTGNDEITFGSDVQASAIVQLSVGDGLDQIHGAKNAEQIVLDFGGSITQDDLSIRFGLTEHNEESIIIHYSSEDAIYVLDGTESQVHRELLAGTLSISLEFANGEHKSLSEILRDNRDLDDDDNFYIATESDTVVNGLSGNDLIYGSAIGDELNGGSGDDQINGLEGDDTLIGHTGNDTLIGGLGHNTYIYELGDGKDTIEFTEGTHAIRFGLSVDPARVSVHRGGFYQLIFQVDGELNAIVFEDYWDFRSDLSWPQTETQLQVEFASSGVIWQHADIIANLNTGNDADQEFRLYDWDGRQTGEAYQLSGGLGNDTFFEGYVDGNTFSYVAGDGRDEYRLTTVDVEYESNRYRHFSQNNVWDLTTIASSRASYSMEADALIVQIDNDPNQTLVIHDFYSAFANVGLINDWFDGVPFVLDRIEFSDRVMTRQDIVDEITAGATTGAYVLAPNTDSEYHGTAQNDVVIIDQSPSTVFFGAGNDLFWRTRANSADPIVYRFDDNGAGVDTILPAYATAPPFQNSTFAPGEDYLVFDTNWEFIEDPMRFGDDYKSIRYGVNDAILLYKGVQKIEQDGFVVRDFYRRIWRGAHILGVDKSYLDSLGRDPNDYWSIYGTDRGQLSQVVVFEYHPEDHGIDFIYGGNANEKIFGGLGNDSIQGNDGDDYIDGGEGDDYLSGGYGDDTLISGGRLIGTDWWGGATLVGGPGNDILIGDRGTDRYRFSPGDGQDVIQPVGGSDWDYVHIDGDVLQEDLTAERSDGDLIINYTPFDSFRIEDYFAIEGDSWVINSRYIFDFEVTNMRGFSISQRLIAPLLNGENTPPISVEDNFSLFSNSVLTLRDLDLLGNDTDADDDSLSVLSVGNAVNGSVSMDVNGETITFVPDRYSIGLASFDYIVVDSHGGQSTATVVIDLSSANVLRGDNNSEVLTANNNGQTIYGREGNDELLGGSGNDTLVGGLGNDIISGGEGDDIFYQTSLHNGVDQLDGGAGFDSLFGHDVVFGGEQDDIFEFSRVENIELIHGGAGNNAIYGDASDNEFDFSETTFINIPLIVGFDGNDVITGSNISAQTILGGSGDDILTGGALNDVLRGDVGQDWLFGLSGEDTLFAGNGTDNLFGGPGNDHLRGESGIDLSVGGAGNDSYYWSPGQGNEFIADYDAVDSGTPRHFDRLIFEAGIIGGETRKPTYTDFNWARNEFDDLIITLIDSGEVITIFNWFRHDNYQLHEIRGDVIFDLDQVALDANANLVTTPVPTGGNSPVGLTGADIYQTQCSVCHGVNGSGPIQIAASIANGNLAVLSDYIEKRMPLNSSENCVGECADSVASFIQTWNLSGDDDNDGVSNDVDLCSGSLESEVVNVDGCAASQLDSDNDGITDNIDDCPNTTVLPVYTTGDGRTGCSQDNDNDGVFDGVDLCLGTPAGDPINTSGCSLEVVDYFAYWVGENSPESDLTLVSYATENVVTIDGNQFNLNTGSVLDIPRAQLSHFTKIEASKAFSISNDGDKSNVLLPQQRVLETLVPVLEQSHALFFFSPNNNVEVTITAPNQTPITLPVLADDLQSMMLPTEYLAASSILVESTMPIFVWHGSDASTPFSERVLASNVSTSLFGLYQNTTYVIAGESATDITVYDENGILLQSESLGAFDRVLVDPLLSGQQISVEATSSVSVVSYSNLHNVVTGDFFISVLSISDEARLAEASSKLRIYCTGRTHIFEGSPIETYLNGYEDLSCSGNGRFIDLTKPDGEFYPAGTLIRRYREPVNFDGEIAVFAVDNDEQYYEVLSTRVNNTEGASVFIHDSSSIVRTPVGSPFTFSATATDLDTNGSTEVVEWYSDVDGFLGRGETIDFIFTTEGLREITAITVDRDQDSRTDRMEIDVTDAASGPTPPNCDDGENLIRNCKFDEDSNTARFYNHFTLFGGDSSGTQSIENEYWYIDIENPGSNRWDVAAMQSGIQLLGGQMYQASFNVRADAPRQVELSVSKDASPWTDYSGTTTCDVTTSWSTCSITVFEMPVDDTVRFQVRLGGDLPGADVRVVLDNVYLAPFTFINPGEDSILSSEGTFTFIDHDFVGNVPAGSNIDWSNGEADFIINSVTAETWEVQMVHDVALTQGTEYIACFDAKAAANGRDILFNIDTGAPEWSSLIGGDRTIGLTTTYQSFGEPFTPTASDDTARLVFSMGQSDVDVQFDNVFIFEGNECAVDPNADSDSDGIINADDLCPGTPANQGVNSDGCALSQLDSDNDGVSDDIDQCANTPNGETPNANGCSLSQLDTDNDGVNDALDQCPNTPSNESADATGCSPGQGDDDNDGVINSADLCPNTPAGTTVDSTGCESFDDADSDGVADENDQCANTPADEFANTNGCSAEQLAVPTATYEAGSANGGPGTAGCITTACTDETWGVDLNSGAGFSWTVDGGQFGGEANVFVHVAIPSGTRSMSVWINGQQVDVITTDEGSSPRPSGSEFGPYNVTLTSGLTNTVELRDTENSAEFDVHHARVEGVVVQFDTDNDGVIDALDNCPNTTAGASVDANGCSVDQLDADNDGVSNTDDLCPNTPAGTLVDADGCALPDTDNDGVADINDQCPSTPNGESVNADGCSSSQTDSDNDGVMDNVDQCANTPNSETANAQGCSPSQLDTDNDGVNDATDICANTPNGETANAQGCSPSQLDTDNDGVTDDIDQCANTPNGETADSVGCSESQTDSDNDSVFDNSDLCPNTPFGQVVDANGCALSQLDTDNDGVTDDIDQCANTPNGETPNAQGCSPSQIDSDGDGVSDLLDNCPMTPAGASVDAQGCPSDSDGDGILDGLDACPATPNGESVNASGCSASQLDDDNDGISNAIDLCANTPNGETVDSNGCSDTQKDDDNDGVNNALDICANTPNGETVDANGCSDTQKDDDSDGVNNANDNCANTPAGETADINGCSASQRDTDNDGVSDDLDQCPGTPAGTTVDATGCLAAADEDNDGVPDFRDQCAGTSAGAPVDVDGCALINSVRVEAENYVDAQDNDGGNNGTPTQCTYNGMDVDVQDTTDTGGGCNIGWTGAGEWLEYQVNLSAGTYAVTTRVASQPGGTGATLLLNGTEIGTDNVGPTGGWQAWETHNVGDVTVAAGTHTLRVNLIGGGLNFNWVTFTATNLIVDSDQDGIADDTDQCANTPTETVVDSVGCPVVVDSDGDGVLDNADLCADTPNGASVDSDGCPIDTDGDGVFDGLDQCANTPAGAPINAQGCALDTDNDGVIDLNDQCPSTIPAVPVDANGCELPDTDGDGVHDINDLCPSTPIDDIVNSDGCGLTQLDTDNDGVSDADDTCPATPNGETVDANGCSSSQTDSDNDGVMDNVDQCANTPNGETANAQGCSPSQLDTDNDGVTDDIDQCANTPNGETADGNGCSPSQVDSDNDGVTDNNDLCANTPVGEFADANGCSDSQRDTDNDGVNDATDICANTPNGETANAQGCSPSQLDTDADGVTDNLDNCPNTQSGVIVDANGCGVDTDSDGVFDGLDLCPSTPVGETVNAGGCSSSQIDTDNDGVVDSLDQCANTPNGETADSNGCSPSQLDSDNDGVNDALDQCPGTSNGQTVNANGCSITQLDTDNDGVNDGLDQCANTPNGETANAQGCSPSQLDSDNDGVNDALDQCPNTQAGETVDATGCVASETPIPRIEAENYSNAFDTTTGNEGTPTQCAYNGMNVDVQDTTDTGGGCNVGWTSANEWLEYTVGSAGGNYNVTFRLAGQDANKNVTLLVNGVSAGSVSTDGGGWQTWKSYTINNVSIPNNATLRVVIEDGGVNFNYIDFNLVGETSIPSATYLAADIGTGGCTGASNCTAQSWGIDLNGDTGFAWDNVDGGTGGPADLFVKIAVPGGSRAMSVWVNGVEVSTISTNDAESPRPGGTEFGPFSVNLNAGDNTVELRDTEGTAEFDAHSVRIGGTN